MQPNSTASTLASALEEAQMHGHKPGQAQASPRRGPEPSGAGLDRRREHRRGGLRRDAGTGRGRWGRGRRRGRGGRGWRRRGVGDVDDELHAVAAVARDAADEVVLAGGLEGDAGRAGAVAAERVAGGARRVVRRAHLVHRVRAAGVVER